MRTRNAQEPYTILRAVVGSSVHGLHIDGKDDRDEMAVAVEQPEFVIGLANARFDLDGNFQQGFEHHVERTQPEGKRSGPGDLDRTTYSLKKWMRLACAGNPTVILLLFVPDDYCDIVTPMGEQLRGLAPFIISKEAGPKYIGYMRAQKERLLGLRGQKNVKRPELEEAHGYDVKYANHVLRLAIQGVELMTTGRLTLPMPGEAQALCRAVREGKVGKDDALQLIEEHEERLITAVNGSKLAEHPNWGLINTWLCDTYRTIWQW